ncbi:hypothetical protein MCOR02_004121 [Pyricularia oryzae]|nr:hypothetical protein MCOR02_004121 [Pyricularia oryzae]
MHFAPLLVLAAVGASAHPSGHAHLHRRAHERRNPEPKPDPAVGDMVTATIMGKVVSWTNTYDGSPFIKHDQPADVKAAAVEPAPVPTATPSASPPPPPASPASPPAQNSPRQAALDLDPALVSPVTRHSATVSLPFPSVPPSQTLPMLVTRVPLPTGAATFCLLPTPRLPTSTSTP